MPHVKPQKVITPADLAIASIVTHDELRDSLLDLPIDKLREEKPISTMVVADYCIDMLQKGKLRAGAAAAFPHGLFHDCRKTISVNYSYDKKMRNRTNGQEGAKGGPTWQQAVLMPHPWREGVEVLTPLTVHQADVLAHTVEGWLFVRNARAYLRGEPLTLRQRAAGFGRGDWDNYLDENNDSIPFEDVRPWFYDRAKQPVNHRTITLSNISRMTFGGQTFVVANPA
jgi:hypothetical protein